MAKMHAWVLLSPNKLVYSLEDVPSCNNNQVLVQMDTACICNGSDPAMFEGHTAYQTPYIFGHEPSGHIVAKGSHVKGYEVGNRVTWWFSTGAFAEYVAVDPRNVCMLKLPDQISRTAAPVFELAIASYRAIRNHQITERSKVLILGLGPSGLIILQKAKSLGAAFVAGWDLYDNRLALAEELGCDFTASPKEDAFNRTKVICEDFDLIIDAMGNDIFTPANTLINAMKLGRKGAGVISYGHPSEGRTFLPYDLQGKDMTISSPENDLAIIREMAQEILQFVLEGKIRIDPLVSALLPLNKADEALAMAMNHPDQYIKIILDCKMVE